MASIHEQWSAQFSAFERRGRGWQIFPHAVAPEPPFQPFRGYTLAEIVDDGRRPTALSSFVAGLSRWLASEPAPSQANPDPKPEPESIALERGQLVEFQTALPAKLDIGRDAFATFLDRLAVCAEPVAFELLGTEASIIAQFAAGKADAPVVRRQLTAFFPEATFLPTDHTLTEAWDAAFPDALMVEFGLENEFMLPLATDAAVDPFVGLIAGMSELAVGELALFQVLFQPVENDWRDSTWRTLTDAEDKAIFPDEKRFLIGAKQKFSAPLYGAVVRIAVKADGFERMTEIARELAYGLRVFADPEGNALIPLHNKEYPLDAHADDVLRRQSRRSGMVLNAKELSGFVHFPGSEVAAPKFRRAVENTRPVPAGLRQSSGLCLGANIHLGQSVPVRLSVEQRVRHMHVIGASGTGKSTMLVNLIRQDIEAGEGIGVLDPHGDLVERILGIIPPERVGDVVLVDLADESHSIGFNILSAHSDLEKNLLASDLVSIFQRLSTSWGDQMGSVLQNAILAFLESSQGGTLADLRRFLIEPAFRERFLASVTDPDILYYWRKGFTQLSGNKSIGPVLTRLETFLSPKPIRYMVSQRENRLDFADILDTGKIFLAKLPQGQMGKENAFLLGSLLVSKFQQLAMSRQAQRAESRRPFWLYVDEFQNFITPSMAEILTGARKYRLGLILAHQELRQLDRDREVASAVLSNPYTRVVFRVGDADARTLENGFANFEARDIQNLETGQAICRVEKADGDFNLTIPLPEEPELAQAEATRQAVITASRKRYGTPRADIEAALRAAFAAEDAEPKPAKAKPVPPPVPPEPEPKAAERPKVTGSKEEQAPVAPPVAAAPEVAPAPKPPEEAESSPPPPDLGRGGAQHKAIQRRVKEAAEALGFHSVIEKEVLEGKGSVDLLLVRESKSIACEISLSTSVDHEVGNVSKCLKAGFPSVAVICLSEDRLEKIRAAVVGSLGKETTGGVVFFLPDEFIAHLQSLPLPKPPTPQGPKIIKGYKVKHKVAKTPLADQKQSEAASISSIADYMLRKQKKG